MSKVVLDASALIAFLRKEPGHERVHPVLGHSVISAVNLCETLTKMVEYSHDLEAVHYQISRLAIEVIPFGETDAVLCSALRKQTRVFGLSLGDRACLALGVHLNCPVFTTEPNWLKTGVAAEIIVIR